MGEGRWDEVDKIVVKIAAYLAHYNLTWLCWTAASHLLVFRLVRKFRIPYLVVSDIVQVDDKRQPSKNPDLSLGKHWMPCVIGCFLAGISGLGPDYSSLSFDVEDNTAVAGEPRNTPREEQEEMENDAVPKSSEESSGSEFTPSHGSYQCAHIDALLFFSTKGLPNGLAAPLTLGSPLTPGENGKDSSSSSECSAEGLPYGAWDEPSVIASHIPKLELDRILGKGTTGTVYGGRWRGLAVAVKLSEGMEERCRLRKESEWYSWLSKHDMAQDVLPSFQGWYRHRSFDVLVMSLEGSLLDSWDCLSREERQHLFSMVQTLHRAGIMHGDISPRNILRSPSGELRLIDLSEACRHDWCNLQHESTTIPGSKRRRVKNHHRCGELITLCNTLQLDRRKRSRQPCH
ncbi:hypothetical protein K439DRAFT_1662752 [Ramaria rubella]|nr:hypothetical protein K439DRAFT_1662752 [Ramaria rubella]